MKQNSAAKSPMMAFVELASGCWISQALNVAAKLGVADFLIEGAKSVEELARLTDTHERSLYRLLRTLASVGVFEEVEPHRFALTPIAEYLCTDNYYSLRYQVIMHCDDWHWRAWGEMYSSIKDGKSGVYHVYKANSQYEYFQQDTAGGDNFNKAMIGVCRNFHTPFIESYDFSNCKKIIAIAGGEGTLISSILKAQTHLKGIIFDQPYVAEEAKTLLEKEGIANRCETMGGDMFKSVPPGGDIYTLSYILIDWNDDKVATILKNIRTAIGDTNGKLLVIDTIIAPPNEYQWGKWLDLELLSFGYGGARTKEEFNKLFEKAGFHLARVLSIGTPVSVMELIPS